MSSTPQCSQCGSFNLFTAKYCSNCAAPLGTSGKAQNLPGSNPWSKTSYPQYTYGDPVLSRSLRRFSDIDHTKTGLLLLIIGTILSTILFVNLVGGILVIVGAVLVISGRKSFGDVHSRNTIVSALIYIIGGSAVSLASIGFILTATSAASASSTPGVFNPAFFSQTCNPSFYFSALSVSSRRPSLLARSILQGLESREKKYQGYR